MVASPQCLSIESLRDMRGAVNGMNYLFGGGQTSKKPQAAALAKYYSILIEGSILPTR